MEHLSSIQITDYWQRRLAPGDLGELDAHIASCEPCRLKLQAASPGTGPEIDVEHCEYEMLSAWVDGKLPAGDRAAVEAHLASCEMCRAEADDLKKFSRQLPAPRRAISWRMPLAIAAGMAIAALGIWRWPHTAPAPEPLAVSVVDHDGVVGITRDGALAGLSNLAAGEQAKLLAMLRTGSIPLAPLPPGLVTQASTLLGPAESPAFKTLDPVGRVVLDDRPLFRWTALEEAASYQVQVLSEDYRPVAESPALDTLEWRPTQALPRGSLLTWQVSAKTRGGAQVRSPQPPAPEARFIIAGREQAEQIAAAGSSSHLRRALLFAEAGLAEECRGELNALIARNPASPLVQRWSEDLLRQVNRARFPR